MIDTVWLTTRNFDILSNNKFDERPVIKHTGEYIGKKVCNFGDKEHAQSAPAPGGNITVFDSFGGSQLLEFNVSLPKLLFGHSLTEITPDHFEQCINAIHGQLAFAGVDIDKKQIKHMRLARIDFCRNIQIDGVMFDYLQILKSAIMPHMQTNHKKTTALWLNKCVEFTGYDKVTKTLTEKLESTAAGITPETPRNKLRFENRTKAGNATVFRILKRRTFAECFDEQLAKSRLVSNFDNLRFDLNARPTVCSGDIGYLIASSTRHQIEKFFGMEYLLATVGGDIEQIRQYFSVRYNERQVRNIVKEYRAHIESTRPAMQRTMITEMRHKLAA